MQPMSDKHSAEADDLIKDPRVSSSSGTHHTGRPEDHPDEPLADDPVTRRSEVARFVAGSAFPGTATELRDVAVENHATDEVLDLLDRAPAGRIYANVEELWEDVGPSTGGV